MTTETVAKPTEKPVLIVLPLAAVMAASQLQGSPPDPATTRQTVRATERQFSASGWAVPVDPTTTALITKTLGKTPDKVTIDRQNLPGAAPSREGEDSKMQFWVIAGERPMGKLHAAFTVEEMPAHAPEHPAQSPRVLAPATKASALSPAGRVAGNGLTLTPSSQTPCAGRGL